MLMGGVELVVGSLLHGGERVDSVCGLVGEMLVRGTLYHGVRNVFLKMCCFLG
jgi:hypothetical protein